MEATRLRLRVSPRAGRSCVVGRHGDAWKVRVAAPPEDGRANDAVVRLLADALSLPQASITVVSGYGARDKIVDVAGIEPELTEERLASAAGKERA